MKRSIATAVRDVADRVMRRISADLARADVASCKCGHAMHEHALHLGRCLEDGCACRLFQEPFNL